jgi:GNAT superfamily N-acetyltransferase
LLLAIDTFARTQGVGAALLEEWRESLPQLPDALARAERSAAAKGWRWVGEMEEIAATFEANGLPGGFHRAAAEVYRG